MNLKKIVLNSGNIIGTKPKNRLKSLQHRNFILRSICGDRIRLHYFENLVKDEKLDLEKLHLIFENIFKDKSMILE